MTGAAQGIGAAIAEACVQEGASVVLTDISDRVEHTADSIAAQCPAASVVAYQLDVSRRSDWTEVMAQLDSVGHGIDGLVNNAGINVKHVPHEMPDVEWDRCLDTNLRGAWYGALSVLPQMLARRAGVIVNIASVHGHAIIPGSFPYPVAKHGLIGMTRALGVEYASCGIRVNAISPGYVDTPLIRTWWQEHPDPEAAQRATLQLIPSGKLAAAREVAMAAVFLLSDEAPSINATTLIIDGGSLAQFHP